MKELDPIVFVVDDDRMIREGLQSLIRSVGLRVETFASSQDFLQAKRSEAPACLVLDVRMPGLSGLDLQLKLRDGGIPTPIIFITGHGDIPMSVRAMKEGAHEFLTKPVRGQDLLDAVHKAIASDRLLRQERRESKAIRERFDSLTPREKEVLELVVAGLLNKQIADQLKNERANRQDSSRARHGKNSGRVPGPSRPHGGKTQECPSEVRTHLILMRGTSQKYTFDGIAFEGLPAIKSSRSMPLGESEPAKARRRPPALRPWLSRERPSRSVASDSEVISALA